jgi:hypothetical protein
MAVLFGKHFESHQLTEKLAKGAKSTPLLVYEMRSWNVKLVPYTFYLILCLR